MGRDFERDQGEKELAGCAPWRTSKLVFGKAEHVARVAEANNAKREHGIGTVIRFGKSGLAAFGVRSGGSHEAG
jgi:hypothetical protein